MKRRRAFRPFVPTPCLARAQEGSVFIIVAASILALVGTVGVAVDIGRAQMVQAKLQSAVDAAGLAAGATLNSSDLTTVATKYIQLNFTQGIMGSTLGPISANVSTDQQIVTVSAQAIMPTTLMKIFNRNTVTVDATTQVTRTNKGMELALVLDITGSMWTDDNYIKQRDAATSLLDALYGPSRDTVPNLWVSVVPYVTAVNIGSQSKATQWLTSYDLTKYPASWPNGKVKWKGCVEERAAPADVTDDAPVAGSSAAAVASRWNMFFWPSTGPASDSITFSNNPSNNQTLTINTVVWKFVTGTPSGNQTKIGSNLNATLTSLASNLTASTDPNLMGATYANTGGTKLTITNVGDNTWYNTKTSAVTINEAVNYQNSDPNGGLGPNISCGDPVLALTASKATVKSKVTGLYPWRKGGTMSNVGLAWGWRMLSPKWRGLWDADLVNGAVALPLDYNTPLMQKAVVIETDGQNNFFKSASTTPPYSDYTAFLRLNTTANGGRPDINTTNNNGVAIPILNQKTAAICAAMKQQNIIIYTVTFELGHSAAEEDARDLFRSCATQPSYYFDATDGADLTSAFKVIGDSLANLRISQ